MLSNKTLSSGKPSLLFYRYFLSNFIIVFIVLAVISIVVYSSFINALKKEVESSGISALTQVRTNIDTRLRELERIALHMVTNPDLQAYRMMTDEYESIEFIEELKQYKSGNEFISDIALYHQYRDNQKMYNTTTEVTLGVFFDYLYHYESWGENEFLELFKTTNLPVIRPVEKVITDRVRERDMATYIYPLPPNTNKPLSFVLFMIDREALEAPIKDVMKSYSGYVYVLDENNHPILYLSTEQTSTEAMDILEMAQISSSLDDIKNVKIKNESYSVIRLQSDYNYWSYVTILHTDELLNPVYAKRAFFNIAAITVLLLGTIIAFIIARENYRPLRNLMNVISRQNLCDRQASASNEYSVIAGVIVDAANKNKWLMEELRSKAGLMKTQLLSGVLKGRFNSLDQIANLNDISGLKLPHPYFLVMIFYIDDYSLFDHEKESQEQKLLRFSIVNIIEELAGDIGYGYAVDLENERKIALLLNFQTFSIKETGMNGLISKIREFFRDHYGFTLTIGVGSVCDNLNKIRESFSEADRAIYYRLLKGSDSVIFYEDIRQTHQKEIKYPVDLETQLILSIKQGKLDDVKAVSVQIVNYIEDRITTPESVQCICFGIINSLIKCLNEMEIDARQCIGDEWESLFVQPLETVKELGGRIEVLCNKICQYIEKSRESKNIELRDRLFSILEQNYCSCMLSIDTIAEKSGMSKSYICRYFKDQTGYSLMQYIDILRINMVKKLLKETKLPLGKLISQAGYIDESSFIRKFKKKEGITPMQYRSILQGEGNKDSCDG